MVELSYVAFNAAEAVQAGGGERSVQERLGTIGLRRNALEEGATPFQLGRGDQKRERKPVVSSIA